MKVVIIGAGVAGLSIGWRLRLAGADVTVLERAQPGGGATWASAGMIAATAEIEEAGTPRAELALRSAAMWPHFAREIEEAAGVDVGYRVDGTLIIASGAEEARALKDRAKGSPGLEFLAAASARSLEPRLMQTIEGALLDSTEAQVDNRALGAALALAFCRAGGILQSNEPAVRIEIEHGRAGSVRTPFAHYRADAIIIAAGAWSSRIEGLPPEAIPTVIPVKGEMISLAPVNDPLPKHMIWGNGVYLVPRRDRLLIGATISREGFDTRATPEAAGWLFNRALQLMPSLSEWQFGDHWAGLRPGSPDDLPLIGRSALEGLFIASGQYRNGILFAPAIAEVLTTVVLGRRPREDISAFDPCRFGATQEKVTP